MATAGSAGLGLHLRLAGVRLRCLPCPDVRRRGDQARGAGAVVNRWSAFSGVPVGRSHGVLVDDTTDAVDEDDLVTTGEPVAPESV